MSKKKLGFTVNPIAGMGGRVGLKGTDGQEILRRARELGAVLTSPTRAVEALKEISPIKNNIDLITYPYDMGEDEARKCSFNPIVIGSIERGKTTSTNTKNAAREMSRLKVDLILFAGGDGTARDIYDAIGDKVPALGIPTGVKIHSGVFATSPKSAGKLAAMHLQGQAPVRELEVMDVDEQAFREDRVSAKLCGYLRVPFERRMVQNPKTGSVAGEEEATEAIACEVIDNMQDDFLYIIGPGTTTRPIMEKLGLKKTLLGVDVIRKGELLALDVNEAQLLKLIEDKKAKIVVTVIGGQGYIFGRGNQQISSKVVRKVGKENLIIVATENKVASLRGRPLLVDTDDDEVNEMLKDYTKVITGYGRSILYKVA